MQYIRSTFAEENRFSAHPSESNHRGGDASLFREKRTGVYANGNTPLHPRHGEKFDDLLAELARSKETTKAEIIRRAVASYAVLNEQTTGGKKISITDALDHVVKDVVLP